MYDVIAMQVVRYHGQMRTKSNDFLRLKMMKG